MSKTEYNLDSCLRLIEGCLIRVKESQDKKEWYSAMEMLEHVKGYTDKAIDRLEDLILEPKENLHNYPYVLWEGTVEYQTDTYTARIVRISEFNIWYEEKDNQLDAMGNQVWISAVAKSEAILKAYLKDQLKEQDSIKFTEMSESITA